MLKQKLIGKRIILKRNKPTLKMAEAMFALIDCNRKHLRPWFPWEALTLKVEDSFKYLLENDEKFKKGEKIEYGIYIGAEYAGNIGVFSINQDRKSAEIGYWLSDKFLRHGYMTEAVKVIEKEFFTGGGLNRIVIRCDEKNPASEGVIKKCAYKYEGCAREEVYSKHFKSFRNMRIFSKLKSEFKKQK